MDSNLIYKNKEEEDNTEVRISEKCDIEVENSIENSLENNSVKERSPMPSVLNLSQTNSDSEFDKEDTFEKNNCSTAFIRTILTAIDCPKNSVEVFNKLKSESVNTGLSQENVTKEIFIDNAEEERKLPVDSTRKAIEDNVTVESEDICVDESYSSKDNKHAFDSVIRKIIHLPEGYTDSSHSSSSELQMSAVPFESSCSSQENNFNSNRINFENALPPTPVWKEFNEFTTPEVPIPLKPTIQELSSEPEVPPPPDIPVITLDENTEPDVVDASANSVPVGSGEPVTSAIINQVFPPLPSLAEGVPNTSHSECKTKLEELNANVGIVSTPQPALVIPPTPRKRGRPRKQVLPNPSPLVESWGPNAQEFVAINTPKDPKRSTRSERRVKKKKFDEENEKHGVDDSTPKRRYTKSTVKKKKRRTTYVPKKRGPQAKKKHSEMENIQNFEEETRMSASEGQGGFSSRSGVIGDESQGSFVTAEGQTKSNVNKKGRMEVLTDGCKPITVQQIVEYYWPPPSSLPHGEKPEGLMIQEQITEYLGVKSFKRKYPSIKRRPVDMEERNYLQENGFVSENMCDMGLTAVFSADIIEIMYNDFPQKFEEYRKYTREKKAKEQRALREKQAAERADMDPLKEAVESAQTWNTEFNKTRSKVLIGNWYDKNVEDEYTLAMYLKKKEREDLLIMSLRTLFQNFLKSIPLLLSTRGLTYGNPIQLLSPDVDATPDYAADRLPNGLVLSVTFDPNEVEKIQYITDDLPIVASPLRFPCARNSFVVESDEGKSEGEPLCYGDTIYLRLADKTEVPLYVDILVPTLGAPTGKCGFPTAKLKMGKSSGGRFRLLHIRPEMRELTDGSPCAPFEPIVINHAPVNAALSVESYWSMGFFSYECEVSANNKGVIRGKVGPSKVWMFVVRTE